MKTLTLTAAALVVTASLANAMTADLSGMMPNVTFPETVTTTAIPVQRDVVEIGK